MSGQWVGHDRSADLPSRAEWEALRKATWARYGDVCHFCGRSGTDTIHHLGERWDHRVEMLRPVHDRNPPHCHRRETAQQGIVAAAKIREKGKMAVEEHPGMLP